MVLLIVLAAALLVFLTLTYFAKPKQFSAPVRNALICSAHSDDCVIVGAEYAAKGLEYGRQINVVYLTCSATDPLSTIAITRRNEAVQAWQSLGVGNLTFIDLPESPIEGPPSYDGSHITRASNILLDLIHRLPPVAAIIIPAAGESHIDHQNMRAIALDAIKRSERTDLEALEVPEYNNFLSFIHAPQRTLNTIIRTIPLAHRIVPIYSGPANFVDGEPGSTFRGTLSIKRKMLTYFKSQDVQLILKYFGYHTLYRVSKSTPLYRRTYRALGATADWTVIFGYALFLAITFVTFQFFADFLPRPLTVPVAILVASLYAIKYLRHSSSLPTALFVWAASLGLSV